nr:MAG TPA: hypothetical protein [Caudoviricetes sp.]
MFVLLDGLISPFTDTAKDFLVQKKDQSQIRQLILEQN